MLSLNISRSFLLHSNVVGPKSGRIVRLWHSCVIVTQDKRLMQARAFCLTIAGRIPYEIESRPTAELNTYSTSTPSVLFAIPETN